uniref:PIR2-like helical domain-containing protein n=1 Tax=Leersia perrieri TaxID=77586 RepID=A0A0D9WPQ0_9ORYZ
MSGGGSSSSSSLMAESDCGINVVSNLLELIHGYYKAALDRLPVEEMPVLIPRLLDAVSNIIANTVCTHEGNRKRKRNPGEKEREEAMSEIIKDGSSITYLPPNLREGNKIGKTRSLEGLVTFLICYFRHLPVSEALFYLLIAKANLLDAVRFIISNRCIIQHEISSPTTEISLRCAAISVAP